MIKFVTLTALLILSTQIVSANDVLLSRDVSLAEVNSLTPQEFGSDLDILVSVLKNAYGGKDILPRNQFLQLLMGLEKLKLNRQIISSEKLCHQIADLTEMVSDYHLTINLGALTCGRNWPQAGVGPNSGYGASNFTWSLSSKMIRGQSISVLSIKKFSPSASPEWNGFLEAIFNLVKGNVPFVIDLRGNPGGDSMKGLQMAAILYGVNNVKEIPMPIKQIYRQRTPDAWAILANSFWLEMLSYKRNNKNIPTYLSDTYQTLINYRDQSVQGLIPSLEIERLGQAKLIPTTSVQFPIYVLIDRNCGSSCELTLEALEKLPMVETIGENTTGVVQYGNVGTLYLPASHLIVKIPTQGAKYDDQRQVEKIGYAPKWRVPLGQDALDFTFKHFFAQ